MGSGGVKEISLGDDFGEVIVNVNHARVGVHADGRVETYPSAASGGRAANDDTKAASAVSAHEGLPQKVLEVGDRLRDGTVVIAVDLKKNAALFAPAGIFGGKATFGDQHKIPAQLNKDKTRNHGHDDWRNITDNEGKTLSQVWDKVAPDELKGRAAPWFWLASSNGLTHGGRVRRGGNANWGYDDRVSSLSVPCVRTGPVSI